MYYVALVCPAFVNKKVLQYKNWMREHFDCIVALKSPAHITLIPPFWMEETTEDDLVAAIKEFRFPAELISVQLNGFSHFGHRVIFIVVTENPQLNRLKNETEEYFNNVFSFIKKDERPFHPHITIASRDMKPSAFVKAWQHFSKLSFKESFNLPAISLLKLNNGKWHIIAEN